MNDLVPVLCELAGESSGTPTAVSEAPDASSVVALLLGVAHEVEARLEGALAPSGLSLAKFRLLSKLVDAGEPVPLGCLADRCSCVRSNMTQLVDRLESERLVERLNDPKDRRSVLAAITGEGRVRHSEAAQGLAEMERTLLGRLELDDRQVLARLVERLQAQS